MNREAELMLDEIEKAFEEGRTADACNMIDRLVIEGRVNELTELDNAHDELTADLFHEYYLKRIALLSQSSQDRADEQTLWWFTADGKQVDNPEEAL